MSYTETYVSQHASAADTNSGSSAAGPAYTATNGGWNSGTGVFTPGSGNPSLSVSVGDWAAVYTDGAGSTSFVGRVTAVSSTTITLSITAKTGTVPTTAASGISCKVGGAWATLTTATTLVSVTSTNASGDMPRINVKVEGGTAYNEQVSISTNNGGDGQPLTISAFVSTAGDQNHWVSTNRAVFNKTSPTDNLFTISKDHWYIEGIDVQRDAARASKIGIYVNANHCTLLNCKSLPSNVDAYGFYFEQAKTHNRGYRLFAAPSNGSFSAGIGFRSYYGELKGCVIELGQLEINYAYYADISYNLVYGCPSGAGISIARFDGGRLTFNTIGDNSGNGIELSVAGTENSPVAIMNNISAHNGGYDYACTSSSDRTVLFDFNWLFGGTSGQTSLTHQIGPPAQNNQTSASPFATSSATTRKANGDYSTVSGVKATGFPGLMADQSITSKQGYIDPGALQHQDAGGGATNPVGQCCC